jgi:hypothetical protein
LKLPGNDPANSGVLNSTASAESTTCRSSATDPGAGSPGTKAGRMRRPSYTVAVMPGGTSFDVVRKTAACSESSRVLPGISRMRVMAQTIRRARTPFRRHVRVIFAAGRANRAEPPGGRIGLSRRAGESG